LVFAGEPLMRAEEDVVGEGGFEPSFQILDGERATKTNARGVFERPPEPLEPGGGVDVQGGDEALNDAEPRDHLLEPSRSGRGAALRYE
jgi:hypothetical protein